MVEFWANAKNEIINKRIETTPQYKSVIQMDLAGNFIKEWHGVKIVAAHIGVQSSRISDCLKGRRKSAKGFTFKYK